MATAIGAQRSASVHATVCGHTSNVTLVLSGRLDMNTTGALWQEVFHALKEGMQKRAAIARAMALDPQILFLDEPSAGLDPITSAELDQLILSLARNLRITFVVITHELSSIYTIAERVIMLDNRVKNIVATGHPHDLRDHATNPWVRRFVNPAMAGAAPGERTGEHL